MKTIRLLIWLFVAFAFTSCHKPEVVDATLYPLKDYTQDLQQAKTWLPGKWKLTNVSAMIPNPTIPNVELIIDTQRISVVQDGTQIDNVTYELVPAADGFVLRTNAQPREDNWYVRNPSLYLNKTQLYLDLGRALDGPAYGFDKVD